MNFVFLFISFIKSFVCEIVSLQNASFDNMKIILFLIISILLMMNFFKINSIPTNIVNLNEYFDIMNDDYDYTVGESDEQLGRKK